MKDHHKLAAGLARRIIVKGWFRQKEEEPPLIEGQTRKDAYEFAIESAASSLALALLSDRAEQRVEIFTEAAEIAGREFSVNPEWDRPKYSAKGAGAWIATVLRSQITGNKLTNVPWRPKKKTTSKERMGE